MSYDVPARSAQRPGDSTDQRFCLHVCLLSWACFRGFPDRIGALEHGFRCPIADREGDREAVVDLISDTAWYTAAARSVQTVRRDPCLGGSRSLASWARYQDRHERRCCRNVRVTNEKPHTHSRTFDQGLPAQITCCDVVRTVQRKTNMPYAYLRCNKHCSLHHRVLVTIDERCWSGMFLGAVIVLCPSWKRAHPAACLCGLLQIGTGSTVSRSPFDQV